MSFLKTVFRAFSEYMQIRCVLSVYVHSENAIDGRERGGFDCSRIDGCRFGTSKRRRGIVWIEASEIIIALGTTAREPLYPAGMDSSRGRPTSEGNAALLQCYAVALTSDPEERLCRKPSSALCAMPILPELSEVPTSDNKLLKGLALLEPVDAVFASVDAEEPLPALRRPVRDW